MIIHKSGTTFNFVLDESICGMIYGFMVTDNTNLLYRVSWMSDRQYVTETVTASEINIVESTGTFILFDSNRMD